MTTKAIMPGDNHLKQMAKRSRFSNIKKHTHSDGTVCDSKRELKRYNDLLLLQKAGEIRDLKVHPRYPIEIRGIKVRYPSGRQMAYVADFAYEEFYTRELGCGRGDKWYGVIEDCKMSSGYRTEVYRIKKALMLAMGHEIRETT